MTFGDALNSIDAATSDAELATVSCAAKRGSMSGYVFKFTHSRNTLTALTVSGAYYLSMVQADGDQYIYQYNPSTSQFTYKGLAAKNGTALGTGAPDDDTALELTGELMEHVGIGSDWTANTQTVLDGLRTQTGKEW